MTKDDIARMMRQSGIDAWWESGSELREELDMHIERFAVMVATEKQLECIDILMKLHEQAGDRHNYFSYAARALRGE